MYFGIRLVIANRSANAQRNRDDILAKSFEVVIFKNKQTK